jgi:hypothetical protein
VQWGHNEVTHGRGAAPQGHELRDGAAQGAWAGLQARGRCGEAAQECMDVPRTCQESARHVEHLQGPHALDRCDEEAAQHPETQTHPKRKGQWEKPRRKGPR